ncbi:MAG: HopJ type III effector protein [Cocleimonas sp.]|nr:HopJ type III effector protein [Cocleimonas sp.]
MNLELFLDKLNTTPDQLEFSDTLNVIDILYEMTETAFTNGDLYNKAGENSGSCKLFTFAKQQGFDQQQTLACFGAYYRNDVLQHPEADNHQNIRQFITTSWGGISFEGNALRLRQS